MSEDPVEKATRPCPFCGEEIQSVAIKCRYCGSRLDKVPTNKTAVWAFFSNFLGVPIGSVLAIVLGRRALRQVEGSGGRERGRGWAMAGLVWGWGALGIVAVILLMLVAQNAASVSDEDLRTVAADLAFAQRDYFSEHGTYAESDADLEDVKFDDQIQVKVMGSSENFCVEARHGRSVRATWDNQFNEDGTVDLWERGCRSLYAPDTTEYWRESLLEQYYSIHEKDADKELASNKRCFDFWQRDMDEALETARELLFEQEGELTMSEVDQVRDAFFDYTFSQDEQWVC